MILHLLTFQLGAASQSRCPLQVPERGEFCFKQLNWDECSYGTGCCGGPHVFATCVTDSFSHGNWGRWEHYSIMCKCIEPPACPTEPPNAFEPCYPDSHECEYGDCNGSPTTFARCSGGEWMISMVGCAPQCPDDRPSPNERCPTIFEGQTCEYGRNCNGGPDTYATCRQGIWAVAMPFCGSAPVAVPALDAPNMGGMIVDGDDLTTNVGGWNAGGWPQENGDGFNGLGDHADGTWNANGWNVENGDGFNIDDPVGWNAGGWPLENGDDLSTDALDAPNMGGMIVDGDDLNANVFKAPGGGWNADGWPLENGDDFNANSLNLPAADGGRPAADGGETLSSSEDDWSNLANENWCDPETISNALQQTHIGDLAHDACPILRGEEHDGEQDCTCVQAITSNAEFLMTLDAMHCDFDEGLTLFDWAFNAESICPDLPADGLDPNAFDIDCETEEGKALACLDAIMAAIVFGEDLTPGAGKDSWFSSLDIPDDTHWVEELYVRGCHMHVDGEYSGSAFYGGPDAEGELTQNIQMLATACDQQESSGDQPQPSDQANDDQQQPGDQSNDDQQNGNIVLGAGETPTKEARFKVLVGEDNGPKLGASGEQPLEASPLGEQTGHKINPTVPIIIASFSALGFLLCSFCLIRHSSEKGCCKSGGYRTAEKANKKTKTAGMDAEEGPFYGDLVPTTPDCVALSVGTPHSKNQPQQQQVPEADDEVELGNIPICLRNSSYGHVPRKNSSYRHVPTSIIATPGIEKSRPGPQWSEKPQKPNDLFASHAPSITEQPEITKLEAPPALRPPSFKTDDEPEIEAPPTPISP